MRYAGGKGAKGGTKQRKLAKRDKGRHSSPTDRKPSQFPDTARATLTATLQDIVSALEVNLKEGGTLRIPNTVSNRKVVAVMLRLLEDEEGTPLYTFEEISALLSYPDRRNAHNFWREFSQAGSDFQACCERQRKLNSAVHAHIEELWRRDPLQSATAVCQRVKAHFGPAQLSAAAVRQAGTQLDYNPIRRARHRQLAGGRCTIGKSGCERSSSPRSRGWPSRLAKPRPQESSG